MSEVGIYEKRKRIFGQNVFFGKANECAASGPEIYS
jgi:hypothetical protein